MSTAGAIAKSAGFYMSAERAQARIGVHGDTLLVINLFDGSIDYHTLDSNNLQLLFLQEVMLRRYFRAPPPWEDTVLIPWIQLGGNQTRLYAVSQLQEALLDSQGDMFVIRTGDVQWENKDTDWAKKVYKTPGGWAIQNHWLEHYSSLGHFLGAYTLPNEGAQIDLLAVDEAYLYVFDGKTYNILIYGKPGSNVPPCTGVRELSLRVVDEPLALPE